MLLQAIMIRMTDAGLALCWSQSPLSYKSSSAVTLVLWYICIFTDTIGHLE